MLRAVWGCARRAMRAARSGNQTTYVMGWRDVDDDDTDDNDDNDDEDDNVGDDDDARFRW